jgi:DMSO/TMAO reductase YedYZ molybdopterin-dependent catalytic subunit
MDTKPWPGPDERRYGRAAFLGLTAAGLSSLVWGAPVWRAIHGLAKPLASIVPVGGWRIYTVAASMPVFEPATWRLRIRGLVERPVNLSYAELRALPRAGQTSDFHCVTGWSVANVRWAGVRLDHVLAAARLKPEAHALTFVSAEKPYTDSLTLQQAQLKDVLLAYEMDGKPLSRAHGAPVRLVIPEMYGYKSVKWVEEIVATPNPEAGYWEERGYDVDAWVGRSNGA